MDDLKQKMEDLTQCSMKLLFSEYRNQNRTIKELRKCKEELLKENHHLKQTFNEQNEQLHQQLNHSLNSESVHISYINLKEKYDLLSKHTEDIKQEKEILMKHYEEKILHHKNEVEREKRNVELREIEFDEKFQAYQASKYLETDELESKWRSRLDVVNQQLRDSNVTANMLRNQLVDIKNQLSLTSTESDKRIQELEQSLTTAEEKLRRTEEKLINSQQVGVQTYRGETKLSLYTKNRLYAYPIARRSFSNAADDTVRSNSSHYEPLNVNHTKIDSNKNDSLIDSDIENSSKRLKRRKLYSVEDFVE